MSPQAHRTDWKAGRRDMDRSRLRPVEPLPEFIRRRRLEEAAEKRASMWVGIALAVITFALMGSAWWAA